MASDIYIDIKNIYKNFNKSNHNALHNINTKIKVGQIKGLVGPDASGKTTLIRIIAGILLPTSGNIKILDLDIKNNSIKIQENIGYMPQKFGLYEDLSVIENLSLYAKLYQLNQNIRKKRIEKLLSFTNLTKFKTRFVGNLSGGMKQKLGLACTLITNPKILLLDEPGVGVDPISRLELWQIVANLLKENNMAVIWSTSYLNETENCDSVMLLRSGKLLFDGKPNDFISGVNNRVYSIKNFYENQKHQILAVCLKHSSIIDCSLQGESIRFVLAKNTQIPNFRNFGFDNIKCKKINPCFEDAFIDVLGGSPKNKSVLSQNLSSKVKDNTTVIECINLTKKFGNFIAVKNNTYNIKRGEIFGLLGPNGAGKSTTFKMLCGLLQPTKGKALVSGIDLKTSSSIARNHIGYMAQKFSLYPQLNVLQNLNFFAGIYGLFGRNKKNKTKLMIDTFALNNFKNINVSELSLGLKQKLSLACALMHEPDVIFLDEPTSGVDPITRREFWNHINGMSEKGVTIMITTHLIEEAEYCDKISLIYEGQSIAVSSPTELKKLAVSNDLPKPNLEQAFIQLVKKFDSKNNKGILN